MQHNVVKIDMCRSKEFASKHETDDPVVRTAALRKLLDISKRSFPASDKPFPEGSFYKTDGDAVYYIVEKASVALRGSIEFMQSWYHEAMREYPDCRIFMDRGFLDKAEVPGKTELTGKVFENISVFEKGKEEGKIYLTKAVTGHCDQTMARFVFRDSFTPRP